MSRSASFRCTLCVLMASVAMTGCVRRRMTVRTSPAGARGYVDDRHIGVTPFSTEFTYYGTRKIHLERDGMESVTVERTFHAPWYQWPVIDFFAENLWPWEIRDEREVVVQMKSLPPVDQGALKARANGMREEAQMSIAGAGLTPTQTPPAIIPLPNNFESSAAPRASFGIPVPASPYLGPPSAVSPSYRPVIPPSQTDPTLLPPSNR